MGAAFLWPRWEVALLLLGALVVVPLGLALVAGLDGPNRPPLPWQAASWLRLPAALTLAASYLLPAGPRPALLAVPWLTVTGLCALAGLGRLLRRGAYRPEELSVSAGLVYVAVGGGWAVLSRWGRQPLGFSELIVLLTAVHFHYAGFALPLLAGSAGRVFRNVLSRTAALGVIAGVPLVAAGLTLAQVGRREWEPCAAGLLAAAATLTAVLHVAAAFGKRPPAQRLLLALAGLSLCPGMALAFLYAWGRWTGLPWVSIGQMLPYHGAVNALGFALPGLLAWNLAPPPTADSLRPEKGAG